MPEQVDIVIVGAGFGGLGMAIQLERAGMRDFVVLERAGDVGGTWYANQYPGCQCDIPSNLYSFSFAPKADWTHSYPEQPQIHEYLRDCVRRFGIGDRIRLNTELAGARWDAEARRWIVETAVGADAGDRARAGEDGGGDRAPAEPISARVIVAAPGLLSEPSLPLVPGLEDFTGKLFHSARWDHSHDLTGERVALFGTGATAVQIAPRIQPKVAKLSVLQRTPPWVLPHPDREIGPRQKRLYERVPLAQRLARGLVYALRETMVVGFAYNPRMLKVQELSARTQLRRQVKDRALREKLTPRYSIGCKRILLSDTWYPAITAPNAEVVTERVTEVRGNRIVTADGAEREVDTIILATGFTPTDPPIARLVAGAAGATLSETWKGSPQAYVGTTVAGFPNLFLLWGPNLNLGHSSIVYMLESQIRYVMDALRTLRERDAAALEVRPEVQDAWNDELQQRLAGSVWDTGGCSSWYLDSNGRNSVMWPDFTFRYRRRVSTFDPSDYRLEPAGATA